MLLVFFNSSGKRSDIISVREFFFFSLKMNKFYLFEFWFLFFSWGF